MLFFGLSITTNLPASQLLGRVGGREAAWGEILRVEDSHFSLVNQDHEKRLRQEEALVDTLIFTNVEAIKLDLGLLKILITGALIMIHSELNGLSPGNCDDRVALVTESRSQGVAPVEIGHSTGLDVRWAPDADQR